MCAHACGEQRPILGVIPQEVLSSPTRRGYLASSPQGSACLCLLSTAILSMCHHASLFKGIYYLISNYVYVVGYVHAGARDVRSIRPGVTGGFVTWMLGIELQQVLPSTPTVETGFP